MDYLKFVVSNQKEESISIQRVKSEKKKTFICTQFLGPSPTLQYHNIEVSIDTMFYFLHS